MGDAFDGIYFAGSNGVVREPLTATGTDGIELGSGSGRQITGNTANANGVNGIDAATLPGDTLSKNVAFFNTGLGINGGPADTDLGGNRAGGTGRPTSARRWSARPEGRSYRFLIGTTSQSGPSPDS